MKRSRFIIILPAAAVLGFLAIVFFRNREPRYQGRTLTEWILTGQTAYFKFADRHVDGDLRLLAADPTWQTASHAVKQMAPEAIPVLLKWIQLNDPDAKYKVAAWLELHLHFHVKTAREFNANALEGFHLLGEEGRPGWPTLVQLTHSPNAERRIWAMDCLWDSRPDKEVFVPVFLQLIRDPDSGVRDVAASMLHRRFPQEALAAGVYKMYPDVTNEPTEESFTNPPPAKK